MSNEIDLNDPSQNEDHWENCADKPNMEFAKAPRVRREETHYGATPAMKAADEANHLARENERKAKRAERHGNDPLRKLIREEVAEILAGEAPADGD